MGFTPYNEKRPLSGRQAEDAISGGARRKTPLLRGRCAGDVLSGGVKRETPHKGASGQGYYPWRGS